MLHSSRREERLVVARVIQLDICVIICSEEKQRCSLFTFTAFLYVRSRIVGGERERDKMYNWNGGKRDIYYYVFCGGIWSLLSCLYCFVCCFLQEI